MTREVYDVEVIKYAYGDVRVSVFSAGFGISETSYLVESETCLHDTLRGLMVVIDMGDGLNAKARGVEGVGYRYEFPVGYIADDKSGVIYRVYDVPKECIEWGRNE